MAKKLEFTDVTCPQCGQVVLSHTKIDYLYGSPVQKCPFCQAEVIDPFYHEIAIDGFRKDPRERKKLLKDVLIAFVVFAVMAVLNLLSFAIGNASVIMVMLMLFALFLGVFRIVSYRTEQKQKKTHLKKQEDQSRERLMDPAYAKKLADLGYAVPKEYLK